VSLPAQAMRVRSLAYTRPSAGQNPSRRAWAFESPHSDFDARFIDVHGRDGILSIDNRRHVIEGPSTDDIVVAAERALAKIDAGR
jgi:hypothetical protein